MRNTIAVSMWLTTCTEKCAQLIIFSATLTLALPAFCQSDTKALESVFQPIAVPVLYAYATLNTQRTTEQTCWDVLVSEHQLLIRENRAKPWLIKNAVPIAGATAGSVTAAFVFKRHARAAVFKRWGASVILGGAVGGAMVGKAIWEMIFPSAVSPALKNEPSDDVAVEVFSREQNCGEKIDTTHNQSMHRVSYLFNGEEFTTDLPYDPGEAVLIGATGEVIGPARIRLD